jgi:hypothetical protein
MTFNIKQRRVVMTMTQVVKEVMTYLGQVFFVEEAHLSSTRMKVKVQRLGNVLKDWGNRNSKAELLIKFSKHSF